MIRIVFLILVFFATNSDAQVLKWDYYVGYDDIVFTVYRGDFEGDHKDFEQVSNPQPSIESFGPGYYEVTAKNEDKESSPSNSILLTYYYNCIKFDYYPSGKVKYRGEHTQQDATDSDPNWTIIKFYYDENGRISIKRIRTTSWENRDTGW